MNSVRPCSEGLTEDVLRDIAEIRKEKMLARLRFVTGLGTTALIGVGPTQTLNPKPAMIRSDAGVGAVHHGFGNHCSHRSRTLRAASTYSSLECL